ncbi:MAG: hypothetical protein Q4Q62_05845 [Thermoplasmata archaeon]|nr:hypothetical protein [Thermoplasmata archaeon]
MATQSFFEDMVIDTPEAAANFNALFESGVKWRRGNGRLRLVSADDPVVVKFMEQFRKEGREAADEGDRGLLRGYGADAPPH